MIHAVVCGLTSLPHHFLPNSAQITSHIHLSKITGGGLKKDKPWPLTAVKKKEKKRTLYL